MNREIKYRGLSLNGKWRYGLPTILTQDLDSVRKSGTYISNRVGVPMAYSVRPETLTQYVGLLDKNGVDIYEGDILTENIVVDWIEEIGSFGLNKKGWMYTHYFTEGCEAKEIEVIGNIYENGDLLARKE